MTQEKRSNGQPDPEWIQVRRNPYLADYHTGKNTGRHARRRIGQPQGGQTERNAEQAQDRQFGKSVVQSRARQRRARAERQRRRRQDRIRRYLRLSLLCASILVGIVVLKNLLDVPSGTPVEAAA